MGPKQGTNSTLLVPASAPLLRAWCRGSSLCKIYALSVLAYVGSVSEPDEGPITAEILALQRLSAGTFSRTSSLLRRGSSCGLKIDVDSIQLTCKTARFRFASRSAHLSSGMDCIRAAKDHCDRTLDSFTASWDEMCFRSSMAFSTTSAFQRVYGMDSLLSLRSFSVHKMQSGAATLLPQSGNVVGIAQAVCSRSNHVLGFQQHRVHLLRNGLCGTANSCKAGLIVGALRVACNGLPTAARFRTAEEYPGCNSVCSEGLDCLWYFYRCPPWSTMFVLFGPALANELLLLLFSKTFSSKLLFAATDFTSFWLVC